MAKFFSIIISGLILIQSFNIQLNDVLKIDVYLHHLQYHVDEYGDDLFDFISKHYGELKDMHVKNHQEEEKDHSQLPFRNDGCFQSITLYLVQKNRLTFDLNSLILYRSSFFYYLDLFSTFEKQKIFQPPQ